MSNSISAITQIWDKALKKIDAKLNDKLTFDSFFLGTYIYDITDDNTLIIVANSAMSVNLFSNKFFDLISGVISDITETNYKLKFVLAEDIANANKEKESKKVKYFENAKVNSNLTFNNFIVGMFNREASQASILISSNPGKMFNPLFIYSGSGLGKTHLLHAIGNRVIKEGNPNAKVLYISTNDFVEEYIKYIRAEKDNDSLKDYVSSFDVLLLDDVQFLSDKTRTEEMFFYIYQKMINDGKQIVITSDRQPGELKNLEERLVTRFSQGLIVKIDEPDQKTCVEILKSKITSNGLNVEDFDEEVIYFLADKFSKTVRDLEGALNRLLFYAISLKQTKKITIDIATEALNNLVGTKTSKSKLNENKIIDVVADYYNLSPSQLTGKIRTGQIALARHVAMYLIRYVLDTPLTKIGLVFGGKDHTTVMSAISKIEKELKTNQQLQLALEEIKKRVKS